MSEKTAYEDFFENLEDTALYENIAAPVLEEVLFRGGVQTLLTKVIAFCVPYFKQRSYGSIPAANCISAIATGSLIGAVHFSNFKKTEGRAALQSIIIGISGIMFGITKECYGLFCSIVAHAVHNSLTDLSEKLYPELLFSKEEILARKKSLQNI